jgi:hypothetical protein
MGVDTATGQIISVATFGGTVRAADQAARAGTRPTRTSLSANFAFSSRR